MNETSTVILRDGNGRFYLLTPELLSQARATAEEQAECTTAFGEQDVFGYAEPQPPPPPPFVVVTLHLRKS